jgi:hypothetical protein
MGAGSGPGEKLGFKEEIEPHVSYMGQKMEPDDASSRRDRFHAVELLIEIGVSP